jgi:methanogenic corrinoid protein MtbC1
MEDILTFLCTCIERGKVNKKSPHPADLREQDGADELTKKAIEMGINPQDILQHGLIRGMHTVGERFRNKQIFVPDMLMSARAMLSGMEHLKPFYVLNTIQSKGTFIVGTVKGDLHDIGKKIVAMMITGAGWKVIDLGTDVPTTKFIQALHEYPDAVVGLSALLTTTMQNMEQTVIEIKQLSSSTKVIIGGAPVTKEFADKISADAYSPDPQGAVDFLNALPLKSN